MEMTREVNGLRVVLRQDTQDREAWWFNVYDDAAFGADRWVDTGYISAKTAAVAIARITQRIQDRRRAIVS
jgi:hypothetical protein